MIDADFKEEDGEEVIGETQSPVPPTVDTQPKVVKMNFYDALERVASGDKITKLEWDNKLIFGLMDDLKLKLHNEDGTLNYWIISDGDLAGKDWIVL